MVVEMQIILLYAGQYDIPDERGGQNNRGTSISYYFNTNLVAEDNVNGTKGTRPAKSTCDFNLMSKVVKAPALYNASFDMAIGSDLKPVLKICDVDYVSDVEIIPVPSSQFNAAKEKEAAENQPADDKSKKAG